MIERLPHLLISHEISVIIQTLNPTWFLEHTLTVFLWKLHELSNF